MSTFNFGGIPVEPEVKKLREQIEVARDGRLIPHEVIERILGLDHRSHRYRTIISRWRRELLNGPENVYLNGILARGKGFICCDPATMVRQSVVQFKRGSKSISLGTQLVVQAPAQELNGTDRKKKEHITSVLNWVMDAVHGARAMIGRPRKQESLPFRALR